MALKDVIGQDRAVRILTGMLEKQKIVSSYLFTGPPYSGKRFTALQYASALLCQNNANRATSDSCGVCNSCRKASELNHPDIKIITVIEQEHVEIVIEQIRELEEFISLTPTEGKYKIVLIDDADKMTKQAMNAFLKTLEEPPSNCVIILTASKENYLLKTIRSRCLKLYFPPFTLNGYRKLANLKNVNLSDRQIKLRLFTASKQTSLSYEAEELVKTRDSSLNLFMDVILNKKNLQGKDRDEIKERLDYFIVFLRDMAILNLNGPLETLINSDKAKELLELCRLYNIDDIIKCYDSLTYLNRYLHLNLNVGISYNYIGSILKNINVNKESMSNSKRRRGINA
ncbi:DNA polymerase III, delta prime subunit [Candidatus Magnetoovum chiemensis]|nr:DNA polymerase III, delta prime subunit [Candidatus Magnetoovum chiemensis]